MSERDTLRALLHEAWCEDGLTPQDRACPTNRNCELVTDRLIAAGVTLADTPASAPTDEERAAFKRSEYEAMNRLLVPALDAERLARALYAAVNSNRHWEAESVEYQAEAIAAAYAEDEPCPDCVDPQFNPGWHYSPESGHPERTHE